MKLYLLLQIQKIHFLWSFENYLGKNEDDEEDTPRDFLLNSKTVERLRKFT